MAPPHKILLLMNSEYGQANIVLAVAYELALRPNVVVHVSSFPVLEKRVAWLQDSLRAAGSTSSVAFHPVSGLSMKECCERDPLFLDNVAHPPGVKGAVLGYRRLVDIVIPWNGKEYIESCQSCVEIIKTVDPNAIVVDSFFNQAIDACRALSRKYIIVSPNSFRDLGIGPHQPTLAMFWKYPITSSGFPYPLPWSYIPANIYLAFRLIYYFFSSSHLKKVNVYRKKFGLFDNMAIVDPYHSDIQYLCPAMPSTDFPCVIPDNITPCGPIILPAISIGENDPLLAWLENGPTIMVNLGTHSVSDENFATQLARGLRVLLDREKEIQVLWKVQGAANIQTVITDVLGHVIDGGRVKVVAWLDPEPLAVLRHRNTVCSVHHGGANSFFEAVANGMPQIILAQWYDTYEYATRVEWLGVGIYGNRRVAPGVDAEEFGQALMRIIGTGKEADGFRAAAKALEGDCHKFGGRVFACDKILELTHYPK